MRKQAHIWCISIENIANGEFEPCLPLNQGPKISPCLGLYSMLIFERVSNNTQP